jgi:hypothetical protein
MAHVKGHKKGKVQKKKKSKPLTKRIYTGGIFAGPGKITKRKKKQIADLRAKYIKNKKAIEESTDWDQTHDEEKDKLLGKYQDDKGRIIDQTVKDRDLIEDYGLRGAKARSFMTERGEKYSDIHGYPDFKIVKSKKHGGKITYKMTGGQVVDAGYD